MFFETETLKEGEEFYLVESVPSFAVHRFAAEKVRDPQGGPFSFRRRSHHLSPSSANGVRRRMAGETLKEGEEFYLVESVPSFAVHRFTAERVGEVH
ncbi:hypothetical protein PVK06_004030 [Gossypium arboreum]|uniref:Uncharacterized protein n=1 Tax=Gossypium arboreum TaxID=29729 RepID=A0ABR0QQW7_GOSAR|nr:hypothetical protein PVK06_004030 [Gossypium arboreum]